MSRFYWSYDWGALSHAVDEDSGDTWHAVCGTRGKFSFRGDHGDRHCKRCERILEKRLRAEHGLKPHEQPGPADCMEAACPWPPEDCPFSACPRQPPRNRIVLKG